MLLFPNGPVTMGFEFAGAVLEVGEDVENIQLGDRAGVNPMDRETKTAAGYHYGEGY